jgi:chromosome segregation ATPase
VDQALAALAAKLDDGFGAITSVLAQLRGDVSGLRADVERLRADVEGLRADVERLRADVERLRADVEGLRAAQDRLEANQERLEASHEALRASHEALQASQDRLRADLMARLDRMQDALTSHYESIATNTGASEHLHRLAMRTRDEVREDVEHLTRQVNSMFRIITQLQSEVNHLSRGR